MGRCDNNDMKIPFGQITWKYSEQVILNISQAYILSCEKESKILCDASNVFFSLHTIFCYPHLGGKRFRNFSIKCFQVLTKDSVTVSVDAVVYYRS